MLTILGAFIYTSWTIEPPEVNTETIVESAIPDIIIENIEPKRPTYSYASTEMFVADRSTIGRFVPPDDSGWRLIFPPFAIEQQANGVRIELIWEKKE
jgi:hypothetical protein